MNFQGKYKVRCGTLFAVHDNPAASKGDREIRYKGHSIGYSGQNQIMFELHAVWNENGECVTIQGIVDNVSNYDLVESIEGKDKYSWERGMKVVGCKECEG